MLKPQARQQANHDYYPVWVRPGQPRFPLSYRPARYVQRVRQLLLGPPLSLTSSANVHGR